MNDRYRFSPCSVAKSDDDLSRGRPLLHGQRRAGSPWAAVAPQAPPSTLAAAPTPALTAHGRFDQHRASSYAGRAIHQPLQQ